MCIIYTHTRARVQFTETFWLRKKKAQAYKVIAQRLSVFLMDIRGIAYAFARFHTPHSRTHEGERRAFSRAVPTVTHMREISASRGGRATPRSQHRHCSSVRCSTLATRGARCSGVFHRRRLLIRYLRWLLAPTILSVLGSCTSSLLSESFAF